MEVRTRSVFHPPHPQEQTLLLASTATHTQPLVMTHVQHESSVVSMVRPTSSSRKTNRQRWRVGPEFHTRCIFVRRCRGIAIWPSRDNVGPNPLNTSSFFPGPSSSLLIPNSPLLLQWTVIPLHQHHLSFSFDINSWFSMSSSFAATNLPSTARVRPTPLVLSYASSRPTVSTAES